MINLSELWQEKEAFLESSLLPFNCRTRNDDSKRRRVEIEIDSYNLARGSLQFIRRAATATGRESAAGVAVKKRWNWNEKKLQLKN